MSDTFHPREAVKALLKGAEPSRPLFLPIVFSLGARVENVTRRAFLGNATKIANSLRQVRTHLRADAMTCYFDPLVEAEALGGEVCWSADESAAELHWPGTTPESAPEDIATQGRLPVAAEVIRRLKAVVRDGTLLMAGITGPLTLSAMLGDGLEATSGAIGAIVRAYLEAGADVILFHERMGAVPGEAREEGLAQLATAANIIRFYEALPVALFTGPGAAAIAGEAVRGEWGGVTCAEWETARAGAREEQRCGMALPMEALTGDDSAFADFEQRLQHVIWEARPAVVTTSDDLPAMADTKRLARVAATLVQTP